MQNGCFIVYFMNNYRYFDSETAKYKLKCLLCDNDGLHYDLMAMAHEAVFHLVDSGPSVMYLKQLQERVVLIENRQTR